jgi:hypothetical protein
VVTAALEYSPTFRWLSGPECDDDSANLGHFSVERFYISVTFTIPPGPTGDQSVGMGPETTSERETEMNSWRRTA